MALNNTKKTELDHEEIKSQKLIIHSLATSKVEKTFLEHQACGFKLDFVFNENLIDKSYFNKKNKNTKITLLDNYTNSTGFKNADLNFLIILFENYYYLNHGNDKYERESSKKDLLATINILNKFELLDKFLNQKINNTPAYKIIFNRIKDEINFFDNDFFESPNFKLLIKNISFVDENNQVMPLAFSLIKNLPVFKLDRLNDYVYFETINSFSKNIFLFNNLYKQKMPLNIKNKQNVHFFEYLPNSVNKNDLFDIKVVLSQLNQQLKETKDQQKLINPNQVNDKVQKIKRIEDIIDFYSKEITFFNQIIYDYVIKNSPQKKLNNKI